MDNDRKQFQEENTQTNDFESNDNSFQQNNYNPNYEKDESKSFFTKRKIILLILVIIILVVIGIFIIGSTPINNEGNLTPTSSNLTLKYNNDMSNYYRQDVSTGKNLGDLYMNVQEYNGVIKLDLLNVTWKETNESDTNYAKSYCYDDLKEALNNPGDYNASITFYDKNGNEAGTKLVGNDLKLDVNNNLLTVTVDANKTSDMVVTKNDCSNITSAQFTINYRVGSNNYVINSVLDNNTLTVQHA
jgi:hypothetical protein